MSDMLASPLIQRLMLLLLIVKSIAAESITIESAADLACVGGAGFSKFGGPSSMRSGSPKSSSPSCRLTQPVKGKCASAPISLSLSLSTSHSLTHDVCCHHRITSVTFSYRYASGYGCSPAGCKKPPCCADPPEFEVWAVHADGSSATGAQQGGPIYTSPPLNKYAGDAGAPQLPALLLMALAQQASSHCAASFPPPLLALKAVGGQENGRRMRIRQRSTSAPSVLAASATTLGFASRTTHTTSRLAVDETVILLTLSLHHY